MYKSLKDNYLVIMIGVAVTIYTLQKTAVTLPYFINNYINDILCIPIVLKFSQIIIRYIKSDKQLQLPIVLQITVTVLYALFFEFFVPKWNVRYTADWWDVTAYFMGLFLFQILEYKSSFKMKLI